jgi:hypothetical protein
MTTDDRIGRWLQLAAEKDRPPLELSELGRTIACQSSSVLPRSAVDGGLTDEDAALMSVARLALSEPKTNKRDLVRSKAVLLGLSLAEARNLIQEVEQFSWKPPAGSLGAVRLAYTAEGEVELTRPYEAERKLPPGTLAIGLIDMMWSTPEPLTSTDGRAECPRAGSLSVAEYQIQRSGALRPVRFNPTLMALSAIAAKWTGAAHVVPTVVRLLPGDGLHERGEALSIHDLRVVELELRTLIAHVEHLRTRYEQGESLLFREGTHCLGCGGAWICPAYNKAARALLGRIDEGGTAEEITEHQAIELALAIEQMQSFIKGARRTLRRYATEQGALDLRDGRKWGHHERPVRTMYGAAAAKELATFVGEDLADEAILLSQEQSLRALRKAKSRGIDLNVDDSLALVMERSTRAGAMKTYPKGQWGPHKPEDQ